MKTKYEARLPVRLGPEWDFSLWFALLTPLIGNLFGFQEIAITETNCEQLLPVLRNHTVEIIEYTAECQFRDQTLRLHLREFAKNSRVSAAFAPGANRAPQFFFPRKSGSQNFAGIRYANTAGNERNLNP